MKHLGHHIDLKSFFNRGNQLKYEFPISMTSVKIIRAVIAIFSMLLAAQSWSLFLRSHARWHVLIF